MNFLVDDGRYNRLEEIAKQHGLSVDQLFADRAADLMLDSFKGDLSRVAAELVQKVDWHQLGALKAVISALEALQREVPSKER